MTLVILSLCHFTHPSALLLHTPAPPNTDPTVSYFLCQTTGKTCISKTLLDPSSCLLHEGVGPSLFQNTLTFNLFLLNQLPISIKGMPVLYQVHSHRWVESLLGRGWCVLV